MSLEEAVAGQDLGGHQFGRIGEQEAAAGGLEGGVACQDFHGGPGLENSVSLFRKVIQGLL